MTTGQEDALLARITVDPQIFGGKPIVRGRRLAVEHILGMLAAGDTVDDLLREYSWLEPEDVSACLVYARPARVRDSHSGHGAPDCRRRVGHPQSARDLRRRQCRIDRDD